MKLSTLLNQLLLKNAAPAWAGILVAGSAAPVIAAAEKNLGLRVIGSYATGIFDDTSAEVVAHDPANQWLFVGNSSDSAVDVLSIADPTAPTKIGSLSLEQSPPAQYGIPRGLAFHDGILAVSYEAVPKTAPGLVVLRATSFDASRPAGDQVVVTHQQQVTVGALPDMLTFTPNGRFVLTANEGEPTTYAINTIPSDDPEGSVSIINLSGGVANLSQADVSTADFHAFDGHEPTLREQGVRIYGPNATTSEDLEPEHLTVSHDSRTAWVTLQENNALATIDIPSRSITELIPLGLKNHDLELNDFKSSNKLDVNNTDGGNNIRNWPAMGMYQPDGIATYSFRGQPYLVTANEGDVRTVIGLTPNSTTGSEDIRVGNAAYILDPSAFPNAAVLKTNAQLGRLQVSRLSGDTDGDGDFDEIHSFGGRSFSIWSASGDLVFDSGDQFEQVVKTQLPLNFNANNTNNDRDSRSDDSGPEPECLVLGHAFGRQWAFIGLERIGGIMVYDVTDPANARFSNYVNNRDFGVRPGAGTIPPNPLPNTGDLSPESITFIKEDESPNGRPLLVVTNEVSGTTTLFEITKE